MTSVLPFDLIFNLGNINKISRFTRIGKISKLVKLAKIVRMLKIAKVNNKLVKHLGDVLRIGASTERLMLLVLSFFALQHVTSCLWIFVARFDETSKNNWIYMRNYSEAEDYDLYVTSFYFVVTTFVTVGYGDITAYSVMEKVMCIILMIIGVLVFSFTTGSLSAIITSIDSRETQLKEKIATLNEIAAEYHLDLDTFNRLVKTIKYDHSKKQKDTLHFMEELPHKLKLELAMIMMKKMYANVEFFKDKERSFIAWVARLIRPMNVEEVDYIYKEGEEVVEIYFLIKGTAAYVLPRFDNRAYQNIKTGEHFGHTDLGQDRNFIMQSKNDKRVASFDKDQLIRRFTVLANVNCDLLTLSIRDLLKMKLEFPKIFADLFKGIRKTLNTELGKKIAIIKEHEETKISKKGMSNKMRSRFAIMLLGGIQQKLNESIEEEEEEVPEADEDEEESTKKPSGPFGLDGLLESPNGKDGGSIRLPSRKSSVMTRRESVLSSKAKAAGGDFDSIAAAATNSIEVVDSKKLSGSPTPTV
jgi:Ion channel